MLKTCHCFKKDRYDGEEAQKIYDANTWFISHNVSQKTKILKCSVCSTKWDFKYKNDGKSFTLTKKFKHSELLVDRVVCLSIWNSNFKAEFKNVKVVRVLEDEFGILELSKKWKFEDRNIRYFFIRNRFAGYLSDIFVQKRLPIDAAYLKEQGRAIEEFDDKDYKLKWLGSIAIIE